jgi:integrating conjugative element protein (TIGR03756 family)
MKTVAQRLRSWLAVVLAAALLCSQAAAQQTTTTSSTSLSPPGESASASTSEIFTNTVQAVPSCIKWQPKGVCIWLVCVYFSCSVKTTLRVEHYTPDVTISTYHSPATHPWGDYGRKIAETVPSISKQIMSLVGGNLTAGASVLDLDSAGTVSDRKSPDRQKVRQTVVRYRGADAIGNPVNFIQGAITGNFGTSGQGPTSVAVPTPVELIKWIGDASSQIANQWSTVPSSYTSGQTNYAQSSMGDSAALLGNYAQKINQLSNLYDTLTGNGVAGQGSLNLEGQTGTGGGNTNSGSGDGGGTTVGASTGGSDVMCPPAISPFGLAFQSDLDGPIWRGIVPLESLYPATWLPGMREVGQGALQTWGSVWPRQGSIYQQNPVKASAVISQRVGDIISYGKQPHIYSPLKLTDDPNYRFFGFQGITESGSDATRWQRIFPNPQTTCTRFGVDDSLALIGFGDGQNVSTRGTIFNAWRRQDCCKVASGGVAIFIAAVP